MTDDLEDLKGQLDLARQECRDLKERNEDLEEMLDEQREYVADAWQAIENYSSFLLEPADQEGLVQSRLGTIIDEYNSLADEYNKLLRKHHRLVSDWNRRLIPPVPGRPIQASDDQQEAVRKLRKSGRSLRGIALDTGLSFKTVRTIAAHMERKSAKVKRDRLNRERLLGKLRQADARARKRAKDGLVAESQRLLKDGERLRKAAEG